MPIEVESQLLEARYMDGAMPSVAGFETLTFVIALVGPVVTLLLIAFLWLGARRRLLPAVLPGIPLALTSITLQVLVAGFGILRAFQEIASQNRSGVRNVAGSMAAVTGSFTLAIYLSVGCVVALLIFQMRRQQGEAEIEQTEPENGIAPRIVFSLTVISAFATMAILWFFERTLDLVMVICDPARKIEAQQRLGNVPIADLAGMLSRRLILCEFGSFALVVFLFTAPFWLLAGNASEWVREKSLTLAIVVALCLIPFGIAYHHELLYMISLTQRR